MVAFQHVIIYNRKRKGLNYDLAKGDITMAEKDTKQLEELMTILIDKLITDNRMEDLQRAAKNPEERDRLLKEYKLI